MKSYMVLAVVLGAMSAVAMAEPVDTQDEPIQLTEAQMDQFKAGSSANFPPGQFPAGNPAKAPGNSNPNEQGGPKK
jgi:hypothetical protein